jgi:hypothetical protein
MVSPERTYANATVIGKSFSILAEMAAGYDLRWRDSIRVSALIEKDGPEIQDYVLNEANMKALGGWPIGQELQFINRQRRIRYGLSPDDKDHPNGVSPVDLPTTAKEFAGLSPKMQAKMGDGGGAGDLDDDLDE